jgi:hypothetical protein
MVVFEENLIQTASVIERTEGRLQTLDRMIATGMVETFVVDAADTQHRSEVAGLGKKRMFIPKSIEVDLCGERTCLFPVLRDVVNSEHCGP